MRAARLVVALATVVGLSLTGPLAHAETKVKHDKTADAPGRIDIKRAHYSNRDERVMVIARIPDLGRAGDASLSITRFKVFEAGYVVRIVKRRGSPAKVRLYYFDHFELSGRKCKGLSGQWGDTSIRLAAPTDCLSGHARPRIRVQFGIQCRERIDRAPAVRRLKRD